MNSKKHDQYVKTRGDGEYARRYKLRDTPNLKKIDFELLSKNNQQLEPIRFVTVVDGKEVDYTEPSHLEKKDYYPYGDIQFLRRSNEIKELMKKEHEDVYGISVSGNEVRYCDVYNYDKKFDLIELSHKSYYNNCQREVYVNEHPSNTVQTQAVLSEYMGKKYDFGYTCFDDYLDYRYTFSDVTFKRHDKNLTPLTCGVDGCIFKCCDEKEMKKHQELHNKQLAFPCLNKQCKHSCNSRCELKRHMIQHCKTLFPCLKPNCSFIDFLPMTESTHYKSHENSLYSIPVKRKMRHLCYICKKMYRNCSSHEMAHPEYRYRCRYPNCSFSCSSITGFYTHRSVHYLHDLMKEKDKYNVCLILFLY